MTTQMLSLSIPGVLSQIHRASSCGQFHPPPGATNVLPSQVGSLTPQPTQRSQRVPAYDAQALHYTPVAGLR